MVLVQNLETQNLEKSFEFFEISSIQDFKRSARAGSRRVQRVPKAQAPQ
jgi:hypothetical protein